MNILYVVILLSLICHVYASGTSLEASVPGRVSSVADNGAREFRDAVQDGDVITIQRIFGDADDTQKQFYGEYLTNIGSERLIKLITRAGGFMGCVLTTVLVYADQELVDKILKGIKAKLSDEKLRVESCRKDLLCRPDRFIYLLKRITDKDEQKKAIGEGLYTLFAAKKIESVEPLVHAIDSEPSLSQEVKDYAIQKVFSDASFHPSDENASFAKHYHDHPAVSAKDYSNALYWSYWKGGSKKELFYWLLASADRNDLEAVKSEWKFSRRPREFQDAVNYILSTLTPDAETRHQRWHRKEMERRAARKAEIDEATRKGLPTALLNIITDY